MRPVPEGRRTVARYDGGFAVVAKLADALVSGTSGSNTLEVQVLSTALNE